ncbi:hypothetical protein K490DRAFT_57719 [Saccharata proteae CBS 121410]|uniref:Uncharacterized protein n=1 Tax=Saccharata proteae CBS 121410 TaxID=1314787 RepID=A0A9P4LVW4_9PEZI|nr:hypothetical protein K490DRAFT_57719 [Saccharata proteae CBS 121410]
MSVCALPLRLLVISPSACSLPPEDQGPSSSQIESRTAAPPQTLTATMVDANEVLCFTLFGGLAFICILGWLAVRYKAWLVIWPDNPDIRIRRGRNRSLYSHELSAVRARVGAPATDVADHGVVYPEPVAKGDKDKVQGDDNV